MPFVHAAAALLGYWLGYRTIPRFIRWRIQRAVDKEEWTVALHNVSEARAEVASWDEEHLDVLKRARACRSCWNEAPPGVHSSVAAPSMYAMCYEHKKQRANGFYDGISTGSMKQAFERKERLRREREELQRMTSAKQYSEKDLQIMDREEYLKYVRGLPSKYAPSGRSQP